MTNASGAPAGWYPDPESSRGDMRYWDGQSWTEHRQTLTPAPVAASPAVFQPASVPPSVYGQGQPVVHHAVAAQVAVANVTKSPGMAIASVVLGVGAFFFALVPLVGFFSVPFAVIGLALGIAGLVRASKGFEGKGLSILGIVSSVIALMVTAGYALLFGAATNEVADSFREAPSTAYELRQTSCGTDSLGFGTYAGDLTNRSPERRDFRVEIEFLDGTRVAGTDADSSGSLAPGETGSIDISSFAEVGPGATCRVKKVSFFGR